MNNKPFNYIIGYLYEDVSGNEHIQPYKSHNGAIFNGTIEDAKDSLADVMCAFQEEDWKIFVVSEYKEFKDTITRIDNLFCFKENKTSYITDEGRCSACGISQRDVLEYSEFHHAGLL